jgi:hypothetical protein
MFDVYVRGKGQLLVIRRGAPLPIGFQRGWKRKRAARAVSDDISASVLRTGFYERSQGRLIDTSSGAKYGRNALSRLTHF